MSDIDHKNLMKIALEYRERAYVPYSKFKVGAAVLFESGKIYGGCNVENASFGATNCAERTAIFSGVANGNRKLKELALIGDVKAFTYPCGICRQVITEFAESGDMKIYIIKNENEVLETTLDEVMPGTFTKKDLEK